MSQLYSTNIYYVITIVKISNMNFSLVNFKLVIWTNKDYSKEINVVSDFINSSKIEQNQKQK